MRRNIILMSDAYKYTHWKQLPKKAKKAGAYIESRGCSELLISYTKFFGLQGFIKEYIEGPVLEQWMIDEAYEVLGEVFLTHEYFNKAGWQYILDTYKGYLPARIDAVREGQRIPLKNALVRTINTDDNSPWFGPWLETMLLRATWYPTTVCTVSSYIADKYAEYAEICGAEKYNPFALNDFGARGVSSHESAGIVGAAHLVNFLGTDTIEGIMWARKYYGKGVQGYSVMASEHFTTTIYGKTGELEAYTRFLDEVPNDKIISIVIDSYDTENAVKNLLGGKLKDKILSRTASTVFRPDSGDPVTMSLNVVKWLWEIFGGTVNSKGYMVLNPKVRVIYGDGCNPVSIPDIMHTLVSNKFSIENVIYGMGGKLLQGWTRDTFKFAMKCCWAQIGDEGVDVYKEPKTDSGKNSKRGLLSTIRMPNGEISTVREGEEPYVSEKLLIPIFENGKLLKEWTFEEVKNQ